MNTLFLQVKFAFTSSIATLIDYGIYLFAVEYFFTPVISNVISYPTGILVNFILQKKYVFSLNRKVSHIFILSITFSSIGFLISTVLIYILTQLALFSSNQYISKLIVTGIVFFYNFYTKRYAFENLKNAYVQADRAPSGGHQIQDRSGSLSL